MLLNTQFALDQLEANRGSNVSGVHQDVVFTDDDVADLVEFLKTLTDPCVKDRGCLAPWIPARLYNRAETTIGIIRLPFMQHLSEALPTQDAHLQLRKRGIRQIMLAGMSANLCTEFHLREFMEQGFEVKVVTDATAAAQLPGLDGYAAAMTNVRMIANTVKTTDGAIKQIKEEL